MSLDFIRLSSVESFLFFSFEYEYEAPADPGPGYHHPPVCGPWYHPVPHHEAMFSPEAGYYHPVPTPYDYFNNNDQCE